MAVFFIFIFGLAVGSFLNVLIHRLPKGESILGFSKCQHCRRTIYWSDNIPVLSFLILKGKCRHCGQEISWQYPLVELLTGFLFLFSFWVYPEEPIFLIYILFLMSLLVVIGLIDLKKFLILDSLILTGLIGSLIFMFLFNVSCLKFQELTSCSFRDSLFGVLFFAGLFLLIFLMSKGRGIGFGDVKFSALLGFIFGLINSINLFYLTFLIGFIIAIILLAFKKSDLKTEIPLGSIMAGTGILLLLSGFNLFGIIDINFILRLFY